MRGYTGSHDTGVPVNARAGASRILFIAVMLSLPIRPAVAVSDAALKGIVAEYEGRVFTLKMNMREPPKGSDHVPMLDRNGWHYWDPAGRIVLGAGERVEVTGIFNYSTRGFFLELARATEGAIPAPVSQRPRIRVRCMVEAESNAGAQAAQAEDLIRRILGAPAFP